MKNLLRKIFREIKKSGKYSEQDFEILKSIIIGLQKSELIDSKYKRHPLKGKMKGLESIRIKNDWLLIFKVEKLYLTLTMLDKHSQVYQKFK